MLHIKIKCKANINKNEFKGMRIYDKQSTACRLFNKFFSHIKNERI